MNLSRQTQMVLLRGLALLATIAVAWWATGFTRDGPMLRSILIGYASFFLVGSFLAQRHYATTPVPLLLLLGDLLAIGAAGCWLHEGLEPQVAFLSGYLVAVLVAVVGRNLTAAALGLLAGTMTMGLAVTLFAVMRKEAPDLWLVAYQIVLLGAGSLLAASILGWLDEEARRRQLAERVEQAIRAKESEAAELVTFAQSLAASSSLKEVAEAVVRHLRCFFAVRARAVALEIEGEISGLWEENGSLTEDHIDRRRALLQDVLARAGNHCELPRMEARSSGSRMLSETLDFHTVVEVPIRAAGRIAGVLFLGDGRRGAIPEDRIGMVADVARRVGQAVQRIQHQGSEENRRTALLLRQMREGVMLLGNDGRVLLANPSSRAALGCPVAGAELPESIGDISLEELAKTPAGVSRRFRARIAPDPQLPPAQLACTAVGILDGSKRMGTLITLSDVTDEEMARARLLRSEKLTLVGQTLAGVAHELNNPLTALVGYADLLKAQDVSPKLAATLTKIRDQSVRATRIVRNLLSVARQRNPERSRVDLPEVTHSVIELFAYEARLSNVAIEFDVPTTPARVLGDPHALQQVLVNLVQNAIHSLKESKSERRIHIRMEPMTDVVLCTVTDSGSGIPQDLRARIFQPFFTTKGPNKGTGLGLALSRTIARDHGGDLFLDEDAAPGARFVLRLPALHAGSEVSGENDELEDAQLGLRVLVVDDEKSVREALTVQLGGIGCEATTTASAGEALRALPEGNYDALLVDVRMPGTNGIELFRAVEDSNARFADHTIFMTGDFTNEDVVEAVRATGRPLLEKPFTSKDLRDALRADSQPRSETHGDAPDSTRPPRAPAPMPGRHDSSKAALDHVLHAK